MRSQHLAFSLLCLNNGCKSLLCRHLTLDWTVSTTPCSWCTDNHRIYFHPCQSRHRVCQVQMRTARTLLCTFHRQTLSPRSSLGSTLSCRRCMPWVWCCWSHSSSPVESTSAFCSVCRIPFFPFPFFGLRWFWQRKVSRYESFWWFPTACLSVNRSWRVPQVESMPVRGCHRLGVRSTGW